MFWTRKATNPTITVTGYAFIYKNEAYDFYTLSPTLEAKNKFENHDHQVAKHCVKINGAQIKQFFSNMVNWVSQKPTLHNGMISWTIKVPYQIGLCVTGQCRIRKFIWAKMMKCYESKMTKSTPMMIFCSDNDSVFCPVIDASVLNEIELPKELLDNEEFINNYKNPTL